MDLKQDLQYACVYLQVRAQNEAGLGERGPQLSIGK